MVWVKKVMGWILVGMAVYFIQPLFPKNIVVFFYSLAALTAGIHLGWVDKSQASGRFFPLLKNSVALAGILIALFMVVSFITRPPGVSWQSYSTGLLEKAIQEERPVVMGFYASWCAPCRELDEITFHDPQVVQKSKDFVKIKIDLTTGENKEHGQLVRKYNVKGVPTVVFLDKIGEERLDL